MPHTSMLHVRVDEKLKSEASEKLANVGLTISDAVRILLTRVTKEGGLPVGLTADDAAYDRWFKEKVEQALLSDLVCLQMSVLFGRTVCSEQQVVRSTFWTIMGQWHWRQGPAARFS